MTNILVRKFPGDKYTPYGLASKLGARAILESSTLERGKDRYSLLLIEEAFRIVHHSEEEYMFRSGRAWEKRPLEGKTLADVAGVIAGQFERNGIEIPLPTGGIGYLAFEFSQFCDDIRIPSKPSLTDIPMGIFLFGHVFLVFDHYTDNIWFLGLSYREKPADLEEAYERIRGRMSDMNFNYLAEPVRESRSSILEDPAGEEEFKEGVRFIKEEIVRGNLLQCVLSRRLQVKTNLTALEAYRNLRRENPSPYMFYLDFGDFQLFGASPETHVKFRNSEASLRPIAGTRRRGADRQEDLALEKELLADKKELAEHLMLVDLARNDLGRVCLPGSVNVTEFQSIEKYSRVMHIVSQVEGELLPGTTPADLVRATFPAGTVSGAPKIQAIQTLSALEKTNRGFYAGLVGYIEPDGMDTCITIRSGLMKSEVLTLQSGAGIVAGSEPERELEETREKLRLFAGTLGITI